MKIDTQDISLKGPQRMMLWVRLGYTAVLFSMLVACALLYSEHRAQEARTQTMIALSDQFRLISNKFAAMEKRYVQLTTFYLADSVDPRVDGLSVDEKNAFYATAEPERKIRIPRTKALENLTDIGNDVQALEVIWNQASVEFKSEFVGAIEFIPLEDPFEKFREVLDATMLTEAKSQSQLYYAVSDFLFTYDSYFKQQLVYIEDYMKGYLTQFVSDQAKSQTTFMVLTGFVGIMLGLFVFLPIDITLRRMFSRLVEKTQEANASLIKARSADKAKSEFLATMSHEIRTPMNGVLGMAELLSKTSLDQRQTTFTDIILKSGNSLLNIINDILDFSKIEAEQLSLTNAPFNLLESIEDVSMLMSSKAVDKNIELLVHIDQSIPPCLMGDNGRMRQVLTNLVGNAVKFTEHGHVLIKAKLIQSSSIDGEELVSIRFEIRDTGIGIPVEQIDTVFEKFSQVDGSTTRKHEGTGLGLAISSRLVELMGGQIGVVSYVGKGSTFSFEVDFPVVQNNQKNDSDSVLDLSSSRVLIIDDNPINRTILTEYCNAWNFESAAVESGPLGVKFLEYSKQNANAPVDLVILDFHMPGMNGADVLKAIRHNPAIADTSVLILSSVDQASELVQFSGYEIEGILSKPARSTALLSTIQSILGKTAAPVRAEKQPQHDLQKPSERESEPVLEVAEEKPSKECSEDKPVASQIAPATTGDVSILAAEDNTVNQIVFSEALKRIDYDFKIANDGSEAVEFWKQNKPSIIIMDVSMPNMNGHEATRAIRQLEDEQGLNRTPIIAVTAHAQKSDLDKCMQAGADDYMTKPISPDMLNKKILHWLDAEKELVAAS